MVYNLYNLTMADGQDVPNRKVRLYSLSTCPICSCMKKFLKGHGVECEIIDVDTLESGEQWVKSKELRSYNPKATYPTLVIEQVITGFEEQELKEALGLE